MSKIWIDDESCVGCEQCLSSCPYGAIAILEGKAGIIEGCVSCGACIEACQLGAIKTSAEARESTDLSLYSGVWVFAETAHGALHRGTIELLGCGYELARELSQELCAAILGDKVRHLQNELAACGAAKVYLAEDRLLESYETNAFTGVLSDMIRKYKPNILLFPATPTGRDLAPRIAQRLKVGLTADCTELKINENEKLLLQTRPAFGGNIMATIVSPGARPQMATVRPGVMKPLRRKQDAGALQVIECNTRLDPSDLKTRILDVMKAGPKSVNIRDSRIIISGGRGIRGKSGVRLLEELAGTIGGEVAGSRVAVECGWIPQERQIGQTGHTVNPDLYVACGISGAIQHSAGMQGSKLIVAINRDPDAPIFRISDYGIVGDIFELLPALTEVLKR